MIGRGSREVDAEKVDMVEEKLGMEVKIACKNPLSLKYAYTNQWQEKTAALHRWDFAKACIFDQFDYEEVTGLRLEFENGCSDELRYNTYELANLSIERFEEDLRELASRPIGIQREIIQKIYEHLREHNEWPYTQLLQLKYLDEYSLDFFEIADTIGGEWIRAEGRPNNSSARTKLSFRAILLCEDSEYDMEVFLRVLRYTETIYRKDPISPPEIAMDKLFEELEIPEEYKKRISLVLPTEGSFYGGSTGSQDGGLKAFQVSNKILEYSKIQSAEDYIRFHYKRVQTYKQSRPISELLPQFPQQSPQQSPQNPESASSDSVLSQILTDKELLEKCKPQFEAEHYPEAVHTALSIFEQRMRGFRVKNPRSGRLNNICGQLFNAGTGRVHFPFCIEPDDPQQTGHQQGMLLLYQGAAALRNMTHHQGLPAKRTEALNLMGFINYLLEAAKKSRKGSLAARLKKIKKKPKRAEQ